MEKKIFFIILSQALPILWCFAEAAEIFTDYCRPGLCDTGDGTHIGCLNGTRHNGQFQVPPCKPNTSTLLNLTQAEKDMIVDMHNFQRNYVACGGLMDYYHFRPACRMGAVKWDDELEATAYLHVTYCLFDHDMCRSTLKYPNSGQNLGRYYVGLGLDKHDYKKAIPLHIVTWYIEYQDTTQERLYHYVKNPGDPMIGHFTNSIHEKNTRIGCAFAYIFELEGQIQSSLFSCNYAFTNIGKRSTYGYCKKPASKCKTGTDPKYPYLCSTDEVYDWTRSTRKEDPYDGDDATDVFECGPTPEVVQNCPAKVIKKRTTLKPPRATKKPGKGPGKGPGKAPGSPSKEPVFDYSEEEYDPPDSGSTQIWRECFNQQIFIILIIFLIKIF